MKKKTRNFIAVLLWLMLWQAVSIMANNKIMLVGPVETVICLCGLLVKKDFYYAVLGSTIRIVAGFALSIILSCIFSVISYKNELVRIFLNPFIAFIKTVPVAAVAVILLIWWGSAYLSFFVSFMVVFPVLYEGLLTGLTNTKKEMLEMAYVFGIKGMRKIKYIYMPQIFPFLNGSLKSTVGLCFKSGVAAEIIGLPGKSIGNGIYSSKILLDTPGVFSYTAVVIFVSIIIEWMILGISQKSEKMLHKVSKTKVKYTNTTYGAIELKNVCFGYNKDYPYVINNLSESYNSGEVYILDGPSGSGKSTLIKLLAGIYHQNEGTVKIKGKTGVMFQEDRLLEYMTAEDNIYLVSDSERIIEEMQMLVPEAINKKVSELSGGMRRRVALLRTMLFESDILLLDEPFAGLDEENIKKACMCIKRLQNGRMIILASHIKPVWE